MPPEAKALLTRSNWKAGQAIFGYDSTVLTGSIAQSQGLLVRRLQIPCLKALRREQLRSCPHGHHHNEDNATQEGANALTSLQMAPHARATATYLTYTQRWNRLGPRKRTALVTGKNFIFRWFAHRERERERERERLLREPCMCIHGSACKLVCLCRDAVVRFLHANHPVAQKILSCFAVGLGYDPDHFARVRCCLFAG